MRELARGYMAEAGMPYDERPGEYAPLDTERSKRIADAYDALNSNPLDPMTATAYRLMADETLAQYDYLVRAGIRFVPWGEAGQPYNSSSDMVADVRDNQRLFYFKTISAYEEASFGEGSGDDPAQAHPLLARPGRVTPDSSGQPYDQTTNDLFRAVHDFFGHAKEG